MSFFSASAKGSSFFKKNSSSNNESNQINISKDHNENEDTDIDMIGKDEIIDDNFLNNCCDQFEKERIDEKTEEYDEYGNEVQQKINENQKNKDIDINKEENEESSITFDLSKINDDCDIYDDDDAGNADNDFNDNTEINDNKIIDINEVNIVTMKMTNKILSTKPQLEKININKNNINNKLVMLTSNEEKKSKETEQKLHVINRNDEKISIENENNSSSSSAAAQRMEYSKDNKRFKVKSHNNTNIQPISLSIKPKVNNDNDNDYNLNLSNQSFIKPSNTKTTSYTKQTNKFDNDIQSKNILSLNKFSNKSDLIEKKEFKNRQREYEITPSSNASQINRYEVEEQKQSIDPPKIFQERQTSRIQSNLTTSPTENLDELVNKISKKLNDLEPLFNSELENGEERIQQLIDISNK